MCNDCRVAIYKLGGYFHMYNKTKLIDIIDYTSLGICEYKLSISKFKDNYFLPRHGIISMPKLSFHTKHMAMSCCNVQPDMDS